MNLHIETIRHLRPEGGWATLGDEFEGIKFLECESFTKKEYTDIKNKIVQIKADEENEKKIARANLLNRLGITEDEAKLLLS